MFNPKLKDLVTVREAHGGDLNFIFNAWLKSYRNSTQMKKLSNDVYYSNHKQVVHRLLQNNQVSILCTKEDPEHIIGFMCHSKDTIHYIYIKYNYRKMGLTYMLLDSVVPLGDDTNTQQCQILTTHMLNDRVAGKVFHKDSGSLRHIKLHFNPYI